MSKNRRLIIAFGFCSVLICRTELGQGAPGEVHVERKQFDGMSVPMQENGGVYAVPVSINGALTIGFIIDSAAADVSIPADVVLTLFRTDTLKQSDFLGTQKYTLADGSTVPSPTFRIRSLKVGSITLENVIGSVADVRSTPLLGQSFLQRFQSWSVNNRQHSLTLVSGDVLPDTAVRLNQPTKLTALPVNPAPSLEGSTSSAELDVVKRFYGALALGDGQTASMLVVPEKRTSGPFSAVQLSQFYSSLEQPIHLISEQISESSGVVVRYSYLKPHGSACDASAVVTFDYRNGAESPFIRGIRLISGYC